MTISRARHAIRFPSVPDIDKFAFGSFRVLSIDAAALDGLSKGERAVVALAVFGLSNQEIARRRGSSPRTVANQLASAYRKLGVGSRAELLAQLQGKSDLSP
jgi:DNA-binding CsgD family transcriptional regulator